ncbi:MAG: hypothetical protein WAO83_16855 [Fuerstiella sp.]
MTNLTNNTQLKRDILAEISEMFGVEKQQELRPPKLGEVEVESGHVMVIDDEAINIKLVRKVLQDVGFTDLRTSPTHVKHLQKFGHPIQTSYFLTS